MEVDRTTRANLFTWNVPSLVAVITLSLSVLVWASNVSREFENIQTRIESIEENRKVIREDYDKKLSPILDGNVIYRLTTNEAAIIAANQRMDRIADALGEIREGINKIDTSQQLLTQKLEAAIPSIRNLNGENIRR